MGAGVGWRVVVVCCHRLLLVFYVREGVLNAVQLSLQFWSRNRGVCTCTRSKRLASLDQTVCVCVCVCWGRGQKKVR
jgi:hypothetical protein